MTAQTPTGVDDQSPVRFRLSTSVPGAVLEGVTVSLEFDGEHSIVLNLRKPIEEELSEACRHQRRAVPESPRSPRTSRPAGDVRTVLRLSRQRKTRRAEQQAVVNGSVRERAAPPR